MSVPDSPFISHSPEETRGHAATFAAQAGIGTIICLHGDLGAGKTEWVKGLLSGLGSDAAVTSPTFSLVHEYREGRLPVFHWDLYRLKPTSDWTQIDLPDQLPGAGVTVIEWPRQYPGKWPKETWNITFKILSERDREISWQNEGHLQTDVTILRNAPSI